MDSSCLGLGVALIHSLSITDNHGLWKNLLQQCNNDRITLPNRINICVAIDLRDLLYVIHYSYSFMFRVALYIFSSNFVGGGGSTR